MSDEYKTLLAELAAAQDGVGKPLAKAMAADADEGSDDDGEDDGEEEDEGAGELDNLKKGKGKGKGMAKSFEVVLPGGQKVQAQDGRPMLKAFAQRVDKLAAVGAKQFALIKSLVAGIESRDVEIKELNSKVTVMQEALAKGLEPIEKLQKSVEVIGNAGRGRRSVTVTMPDADGKKAKQEMNSRDFLQKAASLMKADKISAHDLMTAEISINKGLMPDQRIVDLVQAA